MDLYIMRHAIAEEMSETGHDRDRFLTEEGIEKTCAGSKALRKLGIKFDLVLSSPFARAWQTAEIVATELDCKTLLKSVPALGADSAVSSSLQELAKQVRKHVSILIVGHEPILSQLVSVLLSGVPNLCITMKKGSVCKLSCVRPEPGGCRLEWLLSPKQLCRIA